MLVSALLLASLSAAPSVAPVQQDPSVGFAQSMSERHARLVGGVELASSFRPSEAPPLRITDALRFAVEGAPLPLDTGGAVSSDVRQILALLLGLLVGFGLGHLVAGDKEGFILFLVVDIAIIVLSSVFHAAFGWGPFWGLGGVALLISHVIQAIDAYAEAGGARIVELTREKAIRIADTGSPREAPLTTTRFLSFTF